MDDYIKLCFVIKFMTIAATVEDVKGDKQDEDLSKETVSHLILTTAQLMI